MASASWRSIYFLSIGFRFIFALSNSYIHPDEHFQSFEVLVGRMFKVCTNEPWEFDSTAPARSMAPLLVIYYLPLKLARWIALSPMQTWYLVRLVFMTVSWVVTDWCLYRMLPTKQERIKAIFFVSTSFVSLVYQSHTFSNSVETVLVLLTLYFINELRFMRSLSREQYKSSEIVRNSAAIGFLFAIGIFNRVSFPVFFVFPSLFFLQSSLKWNYAPIVALFAFVITAFGCIVTDTIWFSGVSLSEIFKDPWNWSQYVITPFNNLAYNSKYENLAQHGIHPFYTHILVNLPQILGPGLVLLFPGLKNSYWRTTPFVSAISGLIFLSIVPHQELRFLIPIVPLLCSCFDVAALEAMFRKYTKFPSLVMNTWVVFNLFMAVLMGIFHQGGVVPALDYVHESSHFSKNSTALIWWRTYSPPTWMLDREAGSMQIISVDEDTVENVSFEVESGLLSFDTMGIHPQKLTHIIEKAAFNFQHVYLIAPIASAQSDLNMSSTNQIWSYKYHLDLDHLDISSMQSFQPGLAIYSIL